MRIGKIWVSCPDVLDGFFVEIIEPISKTNKSEWQIDCKWFPTVDQCEKWAINQMKAEKIICK